MHLLLGVDLAFLFSFECGPETLDLLSQMSLVILGFLNLEFEPPVILPHFKDLFL
jgi:hypothetical protein